MVRDVQRGAVPILTTLIPFGLLLIAWWLTGRFRRYALDRQLLDIPNLRSSHVVPTPRGGGVAIVLTTLVALPILGALGALTWANVSAFVGGGALVAFVGFADDRSHISPHWRLLGHFAAATWVLVWIGGAPPIVVRGAVLDLRWLGDVLAALYLVWLVNLTNFMDGIDGIAGAEVITVSSSAALLYLVAVPGGTQWLAPLVVASATLGFLVWNWPPAKIFMGDVGSGFLGLMLGALSLHAAWAAPRLLWSWLIMLGVFVVDATVTLLQRVAHGERFHEGHRSHGYQHAASRWGAHLPVTLCVAAINLGWLLPIAVLVARGSLDGLLAVLIAYVPLVVVARWLRAGRPSKI